MPDIAFYCCCHSQPWSQWAKKIRTTQQQQNGEGKGLSLLVCQGSPSIHLQTTRRNPSWPFYFSVPPAHFLERINRNRSKLHASLLKPYLWEKPILQHVLDCLQILSVILLNNLLSKQFSFARLPLSLVCSRIEVCLYCSCCTFRDLILGLLLTFRNSFSAVYCYCWLLPRWPKVVASISSFPIPSLLNLDDFPSLNDSSQDRLIHGSRKQPNTTLSTEQRNRVSTFQFQFQRQGEPTAATVYAKPTVSAKKKRQIIEFGTVVRNILIVFFDSALDSWKLAPSCKAWPIHCPRRNSHLKGRRLQ